MTAALPHRRLAKGAAQAEPDTGIGQDLIDRIRQKTAGRFSNDRIHQVATEVARDFHNARVTAYVQLLIQRKTSERLQSEPEISPARG